MIGRKIMNLSRKTKATIEMKQRKFFSQIINIVFILQGYLTLFKYIFSNAWRVLSSTKNSACLPPIKEVIACLDFILPVKMNILECSFQFWKKWKSEEGRSGAVRRAWNDLKFQSRKSIKSCTCGTLPNSVVGIVSFSNLARNDTFRNYVKQTVFDYVVIKERRNYKQSAQSCVLFWGRKLQSTFPLTLVIRTKWCYCLYRFEQSKQGTQVFWLPLLLIHAST